MLLRHEGRAASLLSDRKDFARQQLAAVDRWLEAWLRRSVGDLPMRLLLRDGSELRASALPPLATVLVKDRKTLASILAYPERRFGEAYASGTLEVEGDLVGLLEAIYRLVDRRPPPPWWRFAGLGKHSLTASRDNVHRHYDLGNDFYHLWLDPEMVYTCAYYRRPELTLEEAQAAKMDLVCRKLALRPGERVVEAGCGWGALALYMARERGVRVTACNISREQVRFARERARREGLADRVEFVDDDYRNLRGPFDVFVSVGMLEHVGLENLSALAGVLDRGFRPGHGRGLLHFIAKDDPQPLNPWITEHVFPGAYAPTVSQVVERVLRPAHLSVLDVENLRLHYARTLEHWGARFEAAADEAAARFGEPLVRAFRLYLAGSQAAFHCGSLQLFQIVFARDGDNDIPWTRAVP